MYLTSLFSYLTRIRFRTLRKCNWKCQRREFLLGFEHFDELGFEGVSSFLSGHSDFLSRITR